jgi:hypothetical protein
VARTGYFTTHREAEDLSDVEQGKLDVLMDCPEVGLVTLSYDAGVNEWNLDGAGLPKTLVVPEPAFRRAVESYAKIPR